MMPRQKEDFATIGSANLARLKASKGWFQNREEFQLDPSGKIIATNLQLVSVTGYEHWEVIGKHISIFYKDEDIRNGRVEEDLAKARISKKFLTTSWMLKKRQFQFWARVSIRCSFHDSGSVSGFRFSLKDHTHKLIANQKLDRFRNEYRNLFDNPFIGIFRVRSIDLRILHLNKKALEIISGKKVKRFDELFNDRGDFEKLIERLIREKTVSAFEFRLHNEKTFWLRVDCQLFPAEGFIEGVISDVTESREQLHQLERLNADLDNFIYRASHDLRSPLTTLMGLINLVQLDKQTDPDTYYAMMKDRITHLDRLLADLAAITYNNKTEVTVGNVDFHNIAEQLCKTFREHCIQFCHHHDLKNLEFKSDEGRIYAILHKLITHSSYYGNGRQTDRVCIAVSRRGNEIMVTVHDRGCTYDPAQLRSLFGLFSKMTDHSEDTGLSMYLVKLLIDKLGGRIDVTSHPDGGTQFSIAFPCLA